MNRNNPPKVNALLFDLGGVLLEIDWMKVFIEWSKYSPLNPSEIANLFQMDEAYKKHERGQISGSEYFSYLREIIEYQSDEASFISGWNSIFMGLINETVDMLGQIDPKISLYMLTNTNVTHEIKWRTEYSSVVNKFHKVFVSSTMGYRKPSQKAFQYTLEEMNCEANSVLFFDDTEENVQGAKAAGLQSILVKQPSDIQSALINCGAL